MKTVKKIVLTGGPCAGKTTAQSWIDQNLSKRGWRVLFVPETATELIAGGVAPWLCESAVDFQSTLIGLQLDKERHFEQGAIALKDDKILIVCDRGALDNRAYMSEPDFAAVLRLLGTSEVTLRDGYDGVFHLVTAAKGALEAYTLSNNKARTETPEQAAALDDKLISAWTGHPHLRVIDNSTGFTEKLERLLSEIMLLLGEPEPCEIERKFLTRYPDIAFLERQPNCRKVEIIQTYLIHGADEEELRVRQRGEDGTYLYTETAKRRVSDVKRVETERRITEKEYLTALMRADTALHQIRKTRYCLTYNNQYFEIDIYPFWKNQAIFEIELREEGQHIDFPPYLQPIREVTGQAEYLNRGLAERIPRENLLNGI